MAEINGKQLRYPELEQLRLAKENGQLGDDEPEYYLMVMGCSFRNMLCKSYPALTGNVVARCAQGYINHCIHKGKLNLTRTQQRRVFSAEECWECKSKFLVYLSAQLVKLESKGKFVPPETQNPETMADKDNDRACILMTSTIRLLSKQ